MKSFFVTCLVWFAFTGRLAAQTQDFTVTPASLADWQLNGAVRAEVQAQTALSLPAGSELVRTFHGGAVILWSVSRPVFASTPADWPVAQVGPAALALTRQGDHGQVVLLVGDVVRPLSAIVPLDAEGRSLQPLELALGYDPVTKTGVVALADQVLAFKDTANVAAIEVSVSAGEQSGWPQDSLIVSVIGADSTANPAKAAARETNGGGGSSLLQTATKRLQRSDAATDTLNKVNFSANSLPATAPVAVAPPTLEIFTPPSVRSGPAAVRAAIARTQGK